MMSLTETNQHSENDAMITETETTSERANKAQERADGVTRWQRYRQKNREKRNAQKREWAERNKEHVRKYQAQWASKQPAQFWNRWPSRPPQRTRKPGRTYAQQLEANRIIRQKQRENLSDSYLRGWMSRTTEYIIKPGEWPADLVQLKRAQLNLIRLCRKSRT